jgi:ribosomal protein S27AE
MIVLFHENVLLLFTYKFVISIKYRNFGAFVYDSAEKQMLSRLKIDCGRCPESYITLARYKNRWGKTGLLLSYQIRSFVIQ